MNDGKSGGVGRAGWDLRVERKWEIKGRDLVIRGFFLELFFVAVQGLIGGGLSSMSLLTFTFLFTGNDWDPEPISMGQGKSR